MKKAAILSVFLIVFLVNPAFGFAGMTADNSTPGQELINATESDADIVLLQHLFEVDALVLRSENKLVVRETLIFKNIGERNFSGLLRTWVPDGAEGVSVVKAAMMESAQLQPLEMVRNGNIISWGASIKPDDPLLPLYVVEYVLPAEPEGTLTETISYSKRLSYPTLINYRYMGRPGLPAVIVKVTKPEGSSIELQDENRNRLSPDEKTEEGNSVLNRFESPMFREIRVEISKPALTLAGILSYLILGLVIILVLSYPLIRKKSGKLQALEEKIRASLKREETEEVAEEAAEEAFEEVVPEPEAGEAAPAEEDAELEGKTPEELESLKALALAKIEELDKEYESGNLMDEEYEELRSSYNAKVEKINKKLQP